MFFLLFSFITNLESKNKEYWRKKIEEMSISLIFGLRTFSRYTNGDLYEAWSLTTTTNYSNSLKKIEKRKINVIISTELRIRKKK